MVALALQQLAIHPLERRLRERVGIGREITVSFTDGAARWTETDAVLVDLSPRGAFVRADRVPGHGQRTLFGMVDAQGGLCAAAGRVVRFDGYGGFGVRFGCVNALLGGVLQELSLVTSQRREPTLNRLSDLRMWIEPLETVDEAIFA
jgi:hypothetical protein